MEDFSTLRYVYNLAQSMRLGADIALIPQLGYPKNLYQLFEPTTPPLTTTCDYTHRPEPTQHNALETTA